MKNKSELIEELVDISYHLLTQDDWLWSPIIDEVREKAEEIYQLGYEEGYDDGFENGEWNEFYNNNP